MKKLVSIIILCLGCIGILEAQNIWKPIETPGVFLCADAQGNLYAQNYYGLQRSQDEGLNWELVLELDFVSSNFIIGEEGRLFVIPWQNQSMFYSDDNGNTWEETSPLPYVPQTTAVTKMYSPSNEIVVCYVDETCFWTIDGGETWSFEGLELDEGSQLSDMIVNAEGDVYVSVWSYSDGDTGIFHSTLSDMQSWEIVAAEDLNIRDMAFDPEGNVVACGYHVDGSSIGFQHTPGFYLFDGTTLAISDGGIVYRPHFVGNQAVLSYSTDHGEHFTEIGEHVPLVDIAPGGDAYFLIKGHDNHLYFDGGGEYWKCIPDADEIISQHRPFAPLGAEWYFHVLSQGPITQPPFYYLKSVVTGTEEVQGHLCSVIDGYRYVYEEDNVVYLYVHSTDSFTVMYDFNAEEGNTWYCDIEEGFTCLVTVESVGSVTWNGHTYRTQYVTGYIPDEGFLIYDGRIIEGIGYEKGLFPHEYVFDGTEYDYMRCYLEDGELLYHEGSYDCDYVPGNNPPEPLPEWYYEIQNENGSITYQYMYQAGDTIIQDEPTHILVKINTLYDKDLIEEITHEYVYERDGKVYWWNKTLEEFTVLYDFGAHEGDSWVIKVGTETLTMHVDAEEIVEYEGRFYRMLHVSDPQDLFSGDIVCGIGHLTSFFPERLMDNGDGLRVEGLRCYWVENELAFKPGDEDCDAIYSEVHGVEEVGPSMDSGNAFTVYPNPTNGILTVHHSAFRIHHSEFQITNLMGQTVLSGNITADNQQINVSSLPQGMYFITVGDMTRKFVVR